MNSFVEFMDDASTLKRTENGAVARETTRSALYDMFALGGAYQNRSDEDIIRLFSDAYAENPKYALKCLFYLRDVRGGQGFRRFFNVAYSWLCEYDVTVAVRFLRWVPEYGRWKDLLDLLMKPKRTEVWEEILDLIARQLITDISSDGSVSLLAKWMPSENASSYKTKWLARHLRRHLGLTSKQYRKMLSSLRKRINLVESMMSQDRWDKIEFDEIPSKAGLQYSRAFMRNPVTAERYRKFMEPTTENASVNAAALYPSDIVHRAINGDDKDRNVVNRYWENLPDYFNGKSSSMICVCDTSGSMWGKPVENSIALSMYAAQHNQGDFHDYFITFSSSPKFVKLWEDSFFDDANRIFHNTINDNTDLNAVFELLFNGVMGGQFDAKDLPETLVVISDMEIDEATQPWYHRGHELWTKSSAQTQMERLRKYWSQYGLKLPKLVYWNVDARNNTVLDLGPDVTLVSGWSPVIFEQICSGKTGYDLMMDKLGSDRYIVIE